jgi:hypothetical protein
MHSTDKATEPQLRDYDRANVIKSAKIVKTHAGYVLVIRLTWKPGDVVIHSLRKGPRAWVSLDRLLAYLDEVAPTIREMDLVLVEPPELAELMQPSRKRGRPAAAAKKSPAKKSTAAKKKAAARSTRH